MKTGKYVELWFDAEESYQETGRIFKNGSKSEPFWKITIWNYTKYGSGNYEVLVDDDYETIPIRGELKEMMKLQKIICRELKNKGINIKKNSRNKNSIFKLNGVKYESMNLDLANNYI